MIGRLAAVVVVAVLAACSSKPIAPRCGFSDFAAAPYDHLVEQVPVVTVVELAGRLKVRPGDFRNDAWPTGLKARIELHGPSGFSEIVEVAADGTFARKGLSSGSYCFKLSAPRFRSMLGAIEIDGRTRRDTRLEIELLIAE